MSKMLGKVECYLHEIFQHRSPSKFLREIDYQFPIRAISRKFIISGRALYVTADHNRATCETRTRILSDSIFLVSRRFFSSVAANQGNNRLKVY